MPINIKVEKKHLYLISAIMIFLVGVGVVIALNSGNYLIHGHTADEIEGGVGGGVSFGAWETTDTSQIGSTGATLIEGSVYQADKNGFVCAKGTNTADYFYVEGLTGNSATSLVRRVIAGDGKYVQPNGICMPVAKNEYWKIYINNGNGQIYWRTFG